MTFNCLQNRTQGSTVYGFQGGPARIFNSKYLILTHEFVYPYRNQFHQAREMAKMLDLDGIVVIGGDDSNTNACLLVENFRSVIFCFLP
ncbi:putative diphosphate--fructose-6-phosphate 1-phosphotransferase [Helianthus anomalus]